MLMVVGVADRQHCDYRRLGCGCGGVFGLSAEKGQDGWGEEDDLEGCGWEDEGEGKGN